MFSSWDRFILPSPFSKGVFVWGEPIEISTDADEAALETSRLDLESALTAVTKQADDLCGQVTPEAEEAPA
ncbi:MAG: hypothetical protein HOF23_02825 [Rhodospirillaceae bacterium]|nr:hypothetical protein [Rhodospirillaceae bacterium]